MAVVAKVGSGLQIIGMEECDGEEDSWRRYEVKGL
jgi:hypothetical protein